MRNLLIIACILTWVCPAANSQEPFRKPKRSGYFFVAPGAISVNVSDFSEPSIQIGGGYEGFLFRGLGIGIDAGALHVRATSGTRQWAAMFSPNLIYDFQRSSSQKLSLFVVGGPLMASAFQVCCGFSFGGGIKYWLGKHYGIRLEFRDNARVGSLHTYHDLQGRIGIAVR